VIRRQPDGWFTVSGDQGVTAFTMFITDGWPQLQRVTALHHAKDHFPETADYHAFCETFGPPPGA
jgi:hypothetical protein